jgi:LIVCS family branched-chain amino acid:cation transporter
VLISLACLVTAVGLTCACAEYFSRVLPLSYKTLVIILAAFSLLVSNLGLTKLIAFSIPVLTAIYPPCIVLVALSFCKDFWHVQGRIVAPVMLVSFVFGMVDAVKGAGLEGYLPDVLAHLPLSDQGLAWLIPSLITLFGAFVIDRVIGKRSEALA